MAARCVLLVAALLLVAGVAWPAHAADLVNNVDGSGSTIAAPLVLKASRHGGMYTLESGAQHANGHGYCTGVLCACMEAAQKDLPVACGPCSLQLSTLLRCVALLQLPCVLRCVDSLQLTTLLRCDHALQPTSAMLCFLCATYHYAAPCSLFATHHCAALC